MLVISHRGYHVDAAENTIEAFQAALSIGVDGIETDVCLTADGVPILFHNRVSEDGREVSSISKAALEDAVGYPIPTLDDLEQLIVESGPRVTWDLEVKQPDALDATLSLVNRLRDRARFMITSFWHPVVFRAAIESDVDCGLLVCHYPLPSPSRARWLGFGPEIGTIIWNFERIDATLISDSARAGVRNFVYGAITPQDHAKLISWGADGVITDHPEYVLSRSS
jgi:glycerophosphoryl diester phosphodiesterase